MSVKIVTDSTSDIPAQVATALGITVIPLYVNFSGQSYQDGVDLTADQFYEKLVAASALPTTSTPSPDAFTQIYERLSQEGSDVISIHVSSKLSATYNVATLGKNKLPGCRVEIVDSGQVSMALGLQVIAAAKAAKAGASAQEIRSLLKSVSERSRLFGLLDTLEYLQKGGRIGKAQAFLGTLLQFKPLLGVRDGEVVPLERLRTTGKAVRRLQDLVSGAKVESIAVLHSTATKEAEVLAQALAGQVSPDNMYQARFGPVLGTYVGPRALGVALIEA